MLLKGMLPVWIAWLLLAVPSLRAEVVADDTPRARDIIAEHFSGYRFSIESGVRWQQGTALELVYNGPFLLSELTWDIKDLLYAGVMLRLDLGERWAFQASHWEAITKGRGGMTDYDYLIPWIWTDFSDGTVDINRAYMFELQAAWAFWRPQPAQVQLLGGYRQLYWDWSQYGGDYIYSVNGFRDFRGAFPDDENGINYEQTFYVPYVGVGGRASWRQLSLQGYLHYSSIAWARGFDEHVLRDLFFEDTFDRVTYYAAGMSLVYQPGTRWYLSGAWDWHDIPATRGDVKIIDAVDGSEQRIDDSAGIANRAWSLTLSTGMRF